MAIGYLTIQARTAHDAVPLANVRIAILDSMKNNIYELTTDENGETQLVPLETLDKVFHRINIFRNALFQLQRSC